VCRWRSTSELGSSCKITTAKVEIRDPATAKLLVVPASMRATRSSRWTRLHCRRQMNGPVLQNVRPRARSQVLRERESTSVRPSQRIMATIFSPGRRTSPVFALTNSLRLTTRIRTSTAAVDRDAEVSKNPKGDDSGASGAEWLDTDPTSLFPHRHRCPFFARGAISPTIHGGSSLQEMGKPGSSPSNRSPIATVGSPRKANCTLEGRAERPLNNRNVRGDQIEHTRDFSRAARPVAVPFRPVMPVGSKWVRQGMVHGLPPNFDREFKDRYQFFFVSGPSPPSVGDATSDREEIVHRSRIRSARGPDALIRWACSLRRNLLPPFGV